MRPEVWHHLKFTSVHTKEWLNLRVSCILVRSTNGGGGLKCFPKSGVDGTTKAPPGDSFDHLIARMSQFQASLPII